MHPSTPTSTIVRRALEELTNALSLPAQPNTTQGTTDGRRTSAQLACCVTLTQGAATGIMFPSVPFFFLLPTGRAHAAPWRRRSPRVCCVEDHVDDAWRPQPRSATLPPWVGRILCLLLLLLLWLLLRLQLVPQLHQQLGEHVLAFTNEPDAPEGIRLHRGERVRIR